MVSSINQRLGCYNFSSMDGNVIADSHQYLYSSSCKPYHCKKRIPYSQALHLNRNCSDTNSFDTRCNDLEKWLVQTGCTEQEVGKQTFMARGFLRDSLMDRER